ncbi:MAG: Sensor protein FixL [Pseudomonadota bacterium]|jgi:signal transduction histidine kinase
MSFFDLRTAFVVMGMLYLIMPITVWFALRHVKARSVIEWCGGGIVFGLGLFLLGQRGSWPEWVTYELAAFMINGAQWLRVCALRSELKKPLSPWLGLTLFLSYVLAYSFMRRDAAPDEQSYYLLSLIYLLIYFFWIAALSWQLARTDQILSGYWLTLAYAALFVAIGLQIDGYIRLAGNLHPLYPHPWTVALVLVGNLTAVIGNIAFMGIFVERSVRKQVQMASAQAKTEEGQRLERHLAQLDRARGLGMVSASLAHELSQPMGSLQLIAEQARMEIQNGSATESRTILHLDNILRQSAHITAVLQRIRQWVKNEPFARRVVRVADVHQSVASLLRGAIVKEGIDLRFMQAAEDLTVSADEVQLSQVLLNLYRNAIEATAAQTRRLMEVRMWQADFTVYIEVTDNGLGFGEAALGQGNEELVTTKPGGLGMGLLISRQITEAHGGLMTLSNRPEGGACVRLQWPV